MSKIDYHYEIVGRILVHLIEQGLGRADIESADVMDILTTRSGDEEEVLRDFADVMVWMKSENIIRFSDFMDGADVYYFSNVQLTSKGIEISKIKSSDPAIAGTIQEKVLASESGDIDSPTYTKIGSFVGGLLAGFTQTISG